MLQISNVRAARELLQQDAIRYGAEDSLIVDATRRIYADTAPQLPRFLRSTPGSKTISVIFSSGRGFFSAS